MSHPAVVHFKPLRTLEEPKPRFMRSRRSLIVARLPACIRCCPTQSDAHQAAHLKTADLYSLEGNKVCVVAILHVQTPQGSPPEDVVVVGVVGAGGGLQAPHQGPPQAPALVLPVAVHLCADGWPQGSHRAQRVECLLLAHVVSGCTGRRGGALRCRGICAGDIMLR